MNEMVKMNEMVERLKKILDTPVDLGQGISSTKRLRFWVCLVTMVVSGCFLAHDPLFFSIRTGFQYKSGVLCVVLSYLVLSALFWELLLFGKPKGANFFLQWLALIPFSLFTARMLTKTTNDRGSTLLGAAWEAIRFVDEHIGLSATIENIMPNWISDIFSHWHIALTLVFVVGALCFKKRNCKIGLLFVALLFGMARVIATSVTWQFVVGFLALVAAFALMYNPYDEQCFYYNWINELSKEPIGKLELMVISEIMCKAYKRGKLSYDEVREIILSKVPNGKYDKDVLDEGARSVVERLVLRYDFVFAAKNSSGEYLTINHRLLSYNSLTSALAVYPRLLIVATIAVIWLISPLDIVPDAIPFIGVLDDATITILSMKCITTTNKRDVLGGKLEIG